MKCRNSSPFLYFAFKECNISSKRIKTGKEYKVSSCNVKTSEHNLFLKGYVIYEILSLFIYLLLKNITFSMNIKLSNDYRALTCISRNNDV